MDRKPTAKQHPASVAVSDIARRLQPIFRADAAGGIERVYQFRIVDQDAFHLLISDGTLQVHAGAHAEPSVTMIFTDYDTALGLLEGRVDAMQAFLEGRIRSDGNLILALQLTGLFRR